MLAARTGRTLDGAPIADDSMFAEVVREAQLALAAQANSQTEMFGQMCKTIAQIVGTFSPR